MSKPRSLAKPTAKPAAKTKSAAKAKPAAKTKPATKAELPTAGLNLEHPAFLKLRELALTLPDTKLTMTWGSPHFRVGEKIFCGFGGHGGDQVLSVKLEPAHARSALKEPRFWAAPYVGKHGWVCLDVTQRRSWHEVAALIRESYQLIAPKASLKKLR